MTEPIHASAFVLALSALIGSAPLAATAQSLRAPAATQNAVALQKSLLTADDFKSNTSSERKISEELSDLFLGKSCGLPSSLVNRLKDKGKVVPEELQQALGATMDAKAKYVESKAAQATLHRIVFSDSSGGNHEPRLLGTSTYTKTNLMHFADTVSGAVAFTMDCSGYFSSSVAAEGGFLTSSLKTAAETAWKTRTAFVVIKANVTSPIGLALQPVGGGGNRTLTSSERMSILNSIVYETHNLHPSISDATTISAPRMVEMLWTSNQGESSFQGKANLTADAGLGVTGISISGRAQGDGSVAKGISFSSFRTYVLTDSELREVRKTYGEIKADLLAMVSNEQAARVGPLDEGKIRVLYANIPEQVCLHRTWSAKRSNNAAAGSVQASFTDGEGCTISFSPQESMAGEVITLTSPTAYKAGEVFTLQFRTRS